ncbi:glycosyltransferase family 4 protein [Enterococcus faecium]|uniref:glycosyltransferase family 4 protein n=1 Tax=Enterococcus faecium TaxID=1352 RepID=UPI0015E7E23C|nr:glycosyltransferase family 4 protein [Enterococcus faecium]
MNVLHLCSIYGDSFFENLISNISEPNISTSVFYPRRKDKKFNKYTDLYEVESPVIFNKSDRIFYRWKQHKYLRSIKRKYELSKIDLIHAHTLYTDGYSAYRVHMEFNIPYVVAVRSTDIHYFRKYRKDLYRIAKKILQGAAKIIVLSKSYSKLVPHYFGKDLKSKIDIIPNGLDPVFLENINNIKKKKTDNIKVITVGYISKRKNQIFVCKALNSLYKKGYSVKYTVIGKVLDQQIYDELVSYPFVSYKKFMRKEDLINEYRKNDIFIMPSLSETFGLTYLEAISQNTPVIYSAEEGFDGYFEEGRVGFSVNKNNVKNLQEKILTIHNEPEEFNNISSNAINFDWKNIGKRYKSLYNKILY